MQHCPDAIVQCLDRFMSKGITDCYAFACSYENRSYGVSRGKVRTSDGTEMTIKLDTPFNVGSVTKVVTAALAVKLAEKGILTLDDSVKSYVSEYRYSHTIRHLLLHTAGYGTLDSLPWPAEEHMDAFRQHIYANPVSEAADLSAVYYTQGYTILMDVLESAAGERLESLARTYLFEPLHMVNTTFDTSKWTRGACTLPYDSDNKGPVAELEQLAVTGDSGLYSTAPDMLAFANMLLAEGRFEGKQLFSKAAAKLLLTEMTGGRFNKTPALWVKGERDLYGCFGDLLSASAAGHPGFSGCMLVLDPVSRFAGVLVTNSQKLHADWSNYRKLWNAALGSMNEL